MREGGAHTAALALPNALVGLTEVKGIRVRKTVEKEGARLLAGDPFGYPFYPRGKKNQSRVAPRAPTVSFFFLF